MKKIDKIKFLRFQAFYHDKNTGMVHAHAVYDVSKLRRVEYFELCDLVFEKTLQIYPFAIVIDKSVGWADACCDTVQIMIAIPLSTNVRTTVLEEAENDE